MPHVCSRGSGHRKDEPFYAKPVNGFLNLNKALGVATSLGAVLLPSLFG